MAEPSPEFQPNDEIDELFSRANPNPTRAGCPPHDVLLAVARKKLPIGDPAYEHLAKCSPCYLEFRRIQQSGRQSTRLMTSRAVWGAAAAAVVLLAAGSVWILRPVHNAVRPADSIAATNSTAVAQPMQVDLRKYAASRTDQQNRTGEPVTLTRSNLNLTILLPVGSEPGRYDVQLLDSALRSRTSSTGQADIKNFVTTLQTTMDLSSVTPGTYQLALRHDGDDWRLFPATLK